MLSTKKFDHLTDDQEKSLVEFRAEWLRKGRSTAPIDRETGEKVLTEFYAALGLKRPIFMYCKSPFQMALFPVLLKQIFKDANFREMRKALNSQLDSQLDSQLSSQLRAQLSSQLDSQLSSQLSSQLDSQLSSQLSSQLDSQLYSQLDSQLDSQLRAQLDSQLYSQLDSQLDSQLRAQALKFHNNRWHCQWWTAWLGFYEFPRQTLPGYEYTKEANLRLDQFIALYHSIHAFNATEFFCFISERPTEVHVDEQGRLHNPDGAALVYGDGYKLYSWKGRRIDWEKAHVIDAPDTIKIGEIETEENVEIRRVMIERYGTDKYLLDAGAKEIHRDDWGVLYKKEVKNDEALVMVKVANSTPEPDGSIKDYFLRVPPSIRTARGAVAWTFEMEAREYGPLVQT